MSQRGITLLAVFFIFALFFIVASTNPKDRSGYRAPSKQYQLPEVESVKAEEDRKFRKAQKLREIRLRVEKREREEKARRKEFERRAFHIAFDNEIAKGCDSKAIFKKSLGQWQVLVPEIGSLPVSVIYPKDKNKIIRAVEEIGAGDDVSFKEFCQKDRRSRRPKL